MVIAGQKAKHVERVLDVRQGELGWVVGTVYMDLPLKPNVLEDLARDVHLYVETADFSTLLPHPLQEINISMTREMYQ